MNAANALPTTAVLAQVSFDMRACATAFADAANVFRLAMPQTWTLEDLERRYHGLGRDQILALLATHCGYQGERGKHPVIHLDHVLLVDGVIRAQLAGG